MNRKRKLYLTNSLPCRLNDVVIGWLRLAALASSKRYCVCAAKTLSVDKGRVRAYVSGWPFFRSRIHIYLLQARSKRLNPYWHLFHLKRKHKANTMKTHNLRRKYWMAHTMATAAVWCGNTRSTKYRIENKYTDWIERATKYYYLRYLDMVDCICFFYCFFCWTKTKKAYIRRQEVNSFKKLLTIGGITALSCSRYRKQHILLATTRTTYNFEER